MGTWVLLRGLTRESRHWRDFPEIFRREVPDAQVHMPDLPGNGKLFAQESPLAVGEMAQWCRTRMLAEGVPLPCHLLALSLGAMVAVEWAARHPEEVAGCVLINTSLRPFSPFYHRLRPGSYPKLLRLLLPGTDAGARERAILDLTSSRPGDPEVLEEWVAYRRQCPVSAANALRQLRAAMAYRVPPVRPFPPILVLGSRGDALVNPCCSRRLARDWGTAFSEHPTAGHDLPLDDGPWVAGEVGRWLQSRHRHRSAMSGG